MHILFATTQFVTENQFYGGLSNYIANMASILAEYGHIVTIAVISEKNERFEWKKNIFVERINISQALPNLFENLPLLKNNKEINLLIDKMYQSYILNQKIKRLSKLDKIDLIQYCNSGALSLFRLKHIPCVVRLSNFPSLWRHAYMKEFNFKKAIMNLNAYEKLEIRAIKKADTIVAPSKIIANITEKHVNKKISVIESPFYLDTKNWDYSIYDNLLDGKKYLLFYGSLGYLKGIHIIINIINEVLNKYTDIFFVLVGHDFGIQNSNGKGNRPAYKEVIKAAGINSNRVIYLKEIKKQLLFPIIQNAYACILPSRIDNLPNTCIEAMALGKIVIGTDKASFEQLIIDGQSGFLCKRDSKNSFIQGIDKVMTLTKEEHTVIGEKAKERTQLLSPYIVCSNYERLYFNTIVKR